VVSKKVSSVATIQMDRLMGLLLVRRWAESCGSWLELLPKGSKWIRAIPVPVPFVNRFPTRMALSDVVERRSARGFLPLLASSNSLLVPVCWTSYKMILTLVGHFFQVLDAQVLDFKEVRLRMFH